MNLHFMNKPSSCWWSVYIWPNYTKGLNISLHTWHGEESEQRCNAARHGLMDTHTNWFQLQMSKDVMLNGKIKVTIVNLFTTVVITLILISNGYWCCVHKHKDYSHIAMTYYEYVWLFPLLSP